MLNRRLIRSKVFQAFYALSQDENQELRRNTAYLENSITGVRTNFLVFVHFFLEFTYFIRTKRDPEKRLTSNADDFQRFEYLSLNGLYEELTSNKVISAHIDKPGVRWQEHESLMNLVNKEITGQPFLTRYLETKPGDTISQVAFLKDFMEFVTFEIPDFAQSMEEFEMHWEDERMPILTACRKMLDSFVETGKI